MNFTSFDKTVESTNHCDCLIPVKYVLYAKRVGVCKILNSKSEVQGHSWVVGIDTIRWETYDFLSVFHCNNVSALYRFPDIITYLSVCEFEEVTWSWKNLLCMR